ncbi:MAG: hypothetical protein GF388_05105 [Candidatus Aegiribacteria sp.]|nr:hypothetical protein [Candidatus Aegiribacteria sp.]MBD3294594.1 hypothetical protein [Candidatus Fermentibacteria bacterium]
MIQTVALSIILILSGWNVDARTDDGMGFETFNTLEPIRSVLSDTDPGIDFGSDCTSGRDFQLTLVNSYDVSEWPFGLDAFEPAGYTFIVAIEKSGTPNVTYFDPLSGMSNEGSFGLHGLNGNPYGVAWNNSSDSAASTFLTDNHYAPADTMFLTEDFGATWSMVTDPGGYKFRGMDYDGSWYWGTYGNSTDNKLCRFQLGGPEIYYELPELGPAETPNDVAIVPSGGETLIIVTSYYTEYFLIYSWDGASLTYLGSADLPELPVGEFEMTAGLTYLEANGHLYWSYMVFPPWSDDYWIAELALNETPIQNSTWGSIKSSF